MDASLATSQVESKDGKICSQTESCRGMFQHGTFSVEDDKFPKVGRTCENASGLQPWRCFPGKITLIHSALMSFIPRETPV